MGYAPIIILEYKTFRDRKVEGVFEYAPSNIPTNEQQKQKSLQTVQQQWLAQILNPQACNLDQTSLFLIEGLRMRNEVVEELFLCVSGVIFGIGDAFVHRQLEDLDEIACVSKDLFVAGLNFHLLRLSFLFLFLSRILRLYLFNDLFSLRLLFFLRNGLFLLGFFLLFGLSVLIDFIKHLSHLLVALIANESLNNVVSLIDQVAQTRWNWVPLAIDFKRFIFIINDGNDFARSLSQVLYLEERMVVLDGGFASFAEIKVRTDGTFVTDSNNAFLATTITVNSLVDHGFSSVVARLLDDRLFHDKRLVVATVVQGVSGLFFDFFRNLFFYLSDDGGQHLLQFLFNQVITDLRLFDLHFHFSLFWCTFLLQHLWCRCWLFIEYLNLRDLFLDDLNFGLFELYLIGSLNKFFVAFANGNPDGFECRLQQDCVITLVLQGDLVAILVEIAEGVFVWKCLED